MFFYLRNMIINEIGKIMKWDSNIIQNRFQNIFVTTLSMAV